ncbi:MAG: adenosylcobinamide-phosphate synthase CbiB [Thermodesulfobacteriota bacterium]
MDGALVILLALAADAALGDPPAWPHLVRLMGLAIQRLEAWLRARYATPTEQRLAGVVLTLLVVGGFGWGAHLLLALAGWLWPPLGLALAALLTFQCLALGQLWREAQAVNRPLMAGDLAEARQRLAMIVGRDTAALDEAGVRRALIETVAENFNDGVVAPLFYLGLGGPVLAVAYKAVNTLDSMVGYNNQRYADLGLCSARLDDLAGFVPARLSAVLLAAACRLAGLEPAAAWRGAQRDHAAHKSPNSGWPEAAAAAALGVRLGGPSYYGGVLVEKPWLNPGGRDPLAADVDAMLRLYAAAAVLAGGACLLLVFLFRGWF